MDIKYKIDWVPEAKKQRQLMTQKGPTGIGSKSEEVQDTDQGFYQTMYDTLKQYFSDNEEADKVLTSKEIDRDAITMEALNEFDSLERILTPEDPKSSALPEDQPGQLFDDPAMRTFEGDLYEIKIEKPTEEAQGRDAGTTVSYPRGGSGKEIDLSNYTENFAGVYLKYHEGTEDHKSLEDDTITKAYGVKYDRGLKREDYDSDKEFAAAVALAHRDAAIKKFDDVGADWYALPQSVKFAIVDLHYNVGRIGSTASKDTQEAMLKNTLEYVLMSDKKQKINGTLISLAKRRAWNWNKATADTGLEKITRIEQIPTGRGTKFKYYDKDDNVIHEVNNRSTKPYKILNNGKYKLLTETREVTL